MSDTSSNPIIDGRWLASGERHRPTAASDEVLEHAWNEHRQRCESPSIDEWPELQWCPIDSCAVIFVCKGCECVVSMGFGEEWCDLAEAERVHQFGS
jgi:hypothetical protein